LGENYLRRAPCIPLSTTQHTIPASPAAHRSNHLPVAPEGEGVVALPGLAAAGTSLVELVALVLATRLASSGSKTTRFAVLLSI
jgi:hypothetical protein